MRFHADHMGDALPDGKKEILLFHRIQVDRMPQVRGAFRHVYLPLFLYLFSFKINGADVEIL